MSDKTKRWQYPALAWAPNVTFPERVQLDKFQPRYNDYIFRKPPINVGDFFFWCPNTFFPERVQYDKFQPRYPDYLFRRPPNNVGELFWNPNATFPERVQLDKFAPQYPDLVFRSGRDADFTMGFWGNMTPGAVVVTATPLRMRMGMGV